MVAIADDLDASTLEPVEESFQGRAGHCADLVPDDHTGNELLPHPFQASTPSCHSNGRSCGRSGPGRPWPASLWPGDGSGEDKRISLAEELERSRGFAAVPAVA